MRWLAVLAIVLVGAAIYLWSMLSDGATARPRAQSPRTDVSEEPAVDAGSAVATAPAQARPAPPPRRDPVPVPTKPADRPTAPVVAEAPAPPADATQEDVPWTDEQRQQQLWTAHGRYEKGNYPGALEASLELAKRYPDSLWEQDGWKVAIQAHCAMAEPEKANKLFARMTDKTAIEAATKACTEWGVKLAPSK